jgi:hypothetical protein
MAGNGRRVLVPWISQMRALFRIDLDDLSWVASTARAVTGLDARRRLGSNAKQALQG